MLLGLIGLVLSAWLGQAAPDRTVMAWMRPDVVFRPRQRAVSNWHLEGFAHLDTSPGTALTLLLGRDPRSVTRCVRLNNYWCIKRAGWAGEIAADGEGHVAFASAAEGADVAALLLRRYYIDYGRHSALAIVSHWAPASCGAPVMVRGGPRRAAPADRLAVHGIGGTLRARFLAHRGRRVTGRRRVRMHASVVPDRLIALPAPAPAIAVGLGETPVKLSSTPLSLPLSALAAPPEQSRAFVCSGDTARIQAYAAHAAAGITPHPTDDLKLFDATGRPTGNLARLMRNMAAVEIGPLEASPSLIAAAVERATALAEQKGGGEAAR